MPQFWGEDAILNHSAFNAEPYTYAGAMKETAPVDATAGHAGEHRCEGNVANRALELIGRSLVCSRISRR